MGMLSKRTSLPEVAQLAFVFAGNEERGPGKAPPPLLSAHTGCGSPRDNCESCGGSLLQRSLLCPILGASVRAAWGTGASTARSDFMAGRFAGSKPSLSCLRSSSASSQRGVLALWRMNLPLSDIPISIWGSCSAARSCRRRFCNLDGGGYRREAWAPRLLRDSARIAKLGQILERDCISDCTVLP